MAAYLPNIIELDDACTLVVKRITSLESDGVGRQQKQAYATRRVVKRVPLESVIGSDRGRGRENNAGGAYSGQYAYDAQRRRM